MKQTISHLSYANAVDSDQMPNQTPRVAACCGGLSGSAWLVYALFLRHEAWMMLLKVDHFGCQLR